MLISQLPAHLRAQAEAERERQHPASTNDELRYAFNPHRSQQGFLYWYSVYHTGAEPPRTYPAEDVDVLLDCLTLALSSGSDRSALLAVMDAVNQFKSKYP